MVININPNRVNVSSGAARPSVRRRDTESADRRYAPPARADLNHVPEPETLATLVRSAIAALRSGVYWDRGTIVNLLV